MVQKNTHNIMNLFSLVVIQVSNSLFLLLAFTYVLGVVGTSFFSIIVVTEAVALILLTIVLYGLDVVAIERATLLIAKGQDNRVIKLHYDIIQLRILLLAISAFLLFPVANYYNDSIDLIYISWLMFIAGHILHSSWFFQVTNDNFYPSIITLLSRIAFSVLIFFMVNSKNDYMLFVFFIGGSYFISGLACVAYLFYSSRRGPKLVSKKTCVELLFSARNIATGNIFVIFFRGSNTLILGFFANDLAISLYSLSEKIIKGLQSLVRPFNQFMYPKFLRATIATNNTKDYLGKILAYSSLQLLLSALSIIFIFSFLEKVIEEIYKHSLYDLYFLLTVMSPAIIVGTMNYMFGTAGLNYIGKKAELARMIINTGLLTLIISICLIIIYKEKGAAIAYLLGECLLLIQIFLEYKRTTLSTFRQNKS